MPRFDLVTGVSTGALQAPFALLGTEAALDALVALYRNAAEQFAPTLDWFFWLRRTGGVLNVSRYERTIETAYDQRLVDLLREEFRAGRQLAVGTTDLDLGVGRVWDLSHELAPTPDAVTRFQRVLVASSAIPGLFPPSCSTATCIRTAASWPTWCPRSTLPTIACWPSGCARSA